MKPLGVGVVVALMMAAILSGCIVVPADGYYAPGGYGYYAYAPPPYAYYSPYPPRVYYRRW